ncbi:hypothetical protein [Streptomyces sp. NPDC048551]|uniref:hypothetical protein n=1 Tax=Streptomyces sp. NPDC048551 TaxID=3155758 RepID=UPI00342F8F20
METNAHSPATPTPPATATAAGPALLDGPAARAAFGTIGTGVRIYGVLTGAALLTVIAVAGTGHLVNPFMWIRAILLPLVAVLLHRLAGSASRGSRRSFERLRGVSAVFPVAIVGVDLIPGVCPWWYAALQALCVLPVARVALTLRGAALRAAFPGGPGAHGKDGARDAR